MSDLYNDILLAKERTRGLVRETYLEHSSTFSQRTGADVYFKLENLQHTGSFKYRGATNRIRAATADQLAKGFVTASTGNHGAAFAKAARLAGTKGIVFVPENASPAKLANMEQYGADIRKFGDDGVVAETHARAYAEANGLPFVSPYNDLLVAAGQGAIGMEIEAQLERLPDVVFVAVGGGGLISGIGGYLKTVAPQTQIIGCSPENSKVMIDSVRAGEILDLPSLPTLSDGTAGGVEAGSITFGFVQKYVDDFMTVTETEIADGMRQFMRAHHQLIEGAAGVAVASLLKLPDLAGKTAVVVICGGNISLETLGSIL